MHWPLGGHSSKRTDGLARPSSNEKVIDNVEVMTLSNL